MKLLKLSLPFAVALFVPAAAHADACPALTGANSAYYAGITTTQCNTIMTIDSSGTATITFPNTHPYDGADDDYVGVINNSGGTVMSIALSGPGIFGFDGDGIDGYGIPGNAADLAAYGSGAYGGQDATFAITSGNAGVVKFIGGIAAGGTGYFSLENPPTAGGLVPGPIIIVSSTPEPSSLVLLGSGALGLAGAVRRRRFRP